jgi:hypothetical protein
MAVQTASNPREPELRPLVIVSNCILISSPAPSTRLDYRYRCELRPDQLIEMAIDRLRNRYP